MVDRRHRKSAAGERHARSERLVLIGGFAVALCSLLFFVWLSGEMLDGDTVRFDANVRSAVHAHTASGVTTIMKALTVFGSSVVMIPLSVAILAFCFIQRDLHALKTLAATFGGALVLELVLKRAFHRPRPVPFFDLPKPASFSFPSGHALFSFCFFVGVAALLSPRLAGHAKLLMWIAAALLVAGIGFSRIYLGVHYPTDVLAGYVAGIVWVVTLKFVNEMHHRNVKREWAAT
jgi:undecaprenyl-diphosphatase